MRHTKLRSICPHAPSIQSVLKTLVFSYIGPEWGHIDPQMYQQLTKYDGKFRFDFEKHFKIFERTVIKFVFEAILSGEDHS